MDTGHNRARSRVSTSHHGVRDPVPLNPSGKKPFHVLYIPGSSIRIPGMRATSCTRKRQVPALSLEPR